MDTSWSLGCFWFLIFTLNYVEQTKGDRKIICQGSKAKINCGKESTVDVTSATYGRKDLWTCRRNSIISTSNCGTKNNALTKAKNICNKKHHCTLNASNKVFKHPCPGTSVYLDVTYSCVKGCNKQQFQCANGQCIGKKQVCNGKKNCKDGSDEKDLECKGCKQNQFQCETSKKCIPKKKVCDQKENCKDGSDEKNCPCNSNEFECKTGKQCIQKELVCDRKNDCNDGSDEEKCPCNSNEFECKTSKICIQKDLVCNGKYECNDRSDEEKCNCTSTEFECVSSKKCIKKSLVCDKNQDCDDGSDEANCNTCGIPAIKPILDAADCPKLRIVGGCGVDPAHSWPWAVQLLYDNYGNGTFKHECGAALLSPMFALTASHCFLSSRNTERWQAIAGRHNKYGEEANNQIKKIAKIVSFPRITPDILDQDVTIIKFATPVTINDYVTPVCLPTREPNENDYCVVVGWGETQDTGSESILKQTLMPIVPKDKCNQTEEFKGEITPYMICGGWEEGKNDACQGDSGGPLMCKIGEAYHLQGVVSWGVDCAAPMLPGVYADVYKFVSWIKQQMSTL